MDAFVERAQYLCFVRIMIFIGVLVAIYVAANAHETGDNLWLWLPFLVALPYIAIPTYIIYRWIRKMDDRKWDRERIKADRNRGGYVSRRVTSEAELRERYYQGKMRKD